MQGPRSTACCGIGSWNSSPSAAEGAQWDTIPDHFLGAATAKTSAYDLRLRIKGGDGSEGALDLTDLEALVQFIQGAASHDPCLATLTLVDVKKGSRIAVLKAQPHQGIPGLLSPSGAIAEIFKARKPGAAERFELPNGILGALKVWTRGGAEVEIAFHAGNALRPRKVTFDHKSLSMVKAKQAKAFTERTFTGRLVRLHSEEDLFGIETSQGVLHCPFPEHEKASWVALYERIVSVRVKAPPRPTSGPWRASETLGIAIQHDPPALDFGEDIPGLVPAKLARESGFNLDDLFPGLEPEDADSLADFLKTYRGQ